ncbi:MAG: SpoIID/LytB domain-containing protein [Lachnospiraceae bacterium]|nr:SpoIID/LytB domain-containing protein [Lachnospiraceae bacterium]
MAIKKILWAVAFLLLLIILIGKPEEEKTEELPDGTYENVYLISLKEEQMKVVVGGREWELFCPLGENVEESNRIVDITAEKNQISGIVWKEGQVSDQVEAVDSTKGVIRLKKYGTLPVEETWKAYQVKEGEVETIKETGGLINWNEVDVIVIDGTVNAVIAKKEPEEKYIKVLIQGETGETHSSVRITASKEFQTVIETEDGRRETKTFPAGEELTIQEEKSGEITCETGKIRILSVKRAAGYPEYRGKLMIRKEEQGYVIVNELLLEEYLYSVVSSEMPSSYPENALNAQAVCARTYALYQRNRSYYSEFGANVDDSVNSQVYNNVAETKESQKAVKTTSEQYLEYENQPIPAYFYSTSCGYTSDASDVWIGEGENPPYLKGHFQGEEEKERDLSSEKAFLAFLSEEQNCFEKEENWFRWKAEFPLEELSARINERIEALRKESPTHYLLKNGKEYVRQEIPTMGMIKKMEVHERSTGGVIKELILEGENASVKVIGEYQIRKLFCLENGQFTLQDGSAVYSSMMPSGFFAMEMQGEGAETKVVFTGGGYGHGVGLSQNGAKAMAKLKYGYEDILNFYYPDVTLVYGY